MAGPGLPTNVAAGTPGHVGHSNTVHSIVNQIDTAIGVAQVGQVLTWNGTNYIPASITPSSGGGGETGTVLPWLVVDGTLIRQGAGGLVYRATGYDCYVMKVAGGTAGQTMNAAQRDAFFAQLRPNSLTRLWATAPTDGTYTWAAVLAELDAIVASAKKYGQRLIFTLTLMAAAANDKFGGKTSTFFTARQWRTSVSGATSLQAWTQAVVDRYKAEPTVSIYDLLNEPSDSGGAITADITLYMQEMEGYVKALAPEALCYTGIGFSANVGGSSQYQTITAGLDFVSHHNYDSSGFQSMQSATLVAALATNKPIIIDEFGTYAKAYYGVWADTDKDTNGLPAADLRGQADLIRSYINSALAIPQVFSVLIWSYMDSDNGGWYDGLGRYEPINQSAARALIRDIPLNSPEIPSNLFSTMEVWIDPTAFVSRYSPGTQIGGLASGDTTPNVIYDRYSNTQYRQTTQATAPFGVRDFYPGYTTLRFAGTQRFFTNGTTGGASNAHTLVAVTTPTAYPGAGAFAYIVQPSSASNGFSVRITENGFVQLYRYNAAIVGTGTTALNQTKPNLIVVKWNATTGAWSIRVNGETDASGTTTATLGSDSMYVGATTAGLIGHIGGLMKFSSALSLADEARAVAYLQRKFETFG